MNKIFKKKSATRKSKKSKNWKNKNKVFILKLKDKIRSKINLKINKS